jgi:branched-chain amino acid transport system ATP-binding protein
MLLEIKDLSLLYGRIRALHGISLEVGDGEIVALIGANGAGKSTTMRAVSGLRPVAAGTITFDGTDITRMRADLRVALGICQAPEGRGIFPGMTVRENLEMGAYIRRDTVAIKQDFDRVMELFPRLQERIKQAGGTLSGGEQQMLAVGRALILNPRVILLDEPLEGLAPILVEELLLALRRIIRDEGTSAILVEQNAQKVLGVTDRAAIIERGAVVYEGASADLAADRAVLESYLGVTAVGSRRRGRH